MLDLNPDPNEEEIMEAGTALVESMHGAGSPQAQRIMILREGEFEKKVKLAKALIGLPAERKPQ